MLNGLIQSMLTGIVPGNRNADNIDEALRECCELLVFPNRPIHTYGFRAALLKSFGFGQVGGEVLVIHPDYVFSQLSSAQLQKYSEARTRRQHAAFRHWQDALTGKRNFVRVKAEPPYSVREEARVYLNPLARAQYSETHKTWRFPETAGGRGAAAAAAAVTAASAAPTDSKSTEAAAEHQQHQKQQQQQQQQPQPSLVSGPVLGGTQRREMKRYDPT
jgi:fatty acid synthase subunit alpha, fungi type